MQQAFALVIFLCATTPSWAAPLHDHCNVLPWTLTATFPTSFPSEMTKGGLTIDPVNPAPAAGNGTPQCPYEVSDVTSVNLTLTFTGPPTLTTTLVSAGNNPSILFYETPEISFTSGVMTSISFASHNTDGNVGGPPPTGQGLPSRLSFPINSLNVNFDLSANPPMDYSITAASVTLKGNHYYRGVSTPTTLMLFILGLLVMTGYRGDLRQNRNLCIKTRI